MSAVAFDLGAFLERGRARVDAALGRALDRWLPEFRPEFAEPTRHGVSTGGKRLRPILCATAYETLSGSAPDAAWDLGVSLELIHAYSLMHDDLPCMDDAELRRGRATPHTIYGEPATAVAGLALIPAASLQALGAARALGCDESTAARIVLELNRAAGAGGMVGGQALDLLGEERDLTAEELDGLHRRKTGALLTASLTIGGIAADADAAQLQALETYGRAVGLAFQVADDILDATATAEELGKNPSDATLGKSTYVALYGLDEARRRGETLCDEARGALRAAGVDSKALDALAAYVVERRK